MAELHGARCQNDNEPASRCKFRQPPAPIRSSVPPCSGLSRPSPAGGREDAASLDRPCARRLRDLAVGAEECSRRGSNKRMEPTYTISKEIADLCSDLRPSLYSVSILAAIHTTLNNEEILLQQVTSGCQLVDRGARELF
jgi:hypothetical protein